MCYSLQRKHCCMQYNYNTIRYKPSCICVLKTCLSSCNILTVVYSTMTLFLGIHMLCELIIDAGARVMKFILLSQRSQLE